MSTLVQRAGDRRPGGVMTGLESMWNGPASCPPNDIFMVYKQFPAYRRIDSSRLGRMPPLKG